MLPVIMKLTAMSISSTAANFMITGAQRGRGREGRG
jgi:hypothetical protein